MLPEVEVTTCSTIIMDFCEGNFKFISRININPQFPLTANALSGFYNILEFTRDYIAGAT